MMHPAFILFYSSLLFSIFLVVSCNSLVVCWLGLEINMLSFIPLMIMKNNKYSSECALKYFLVQAVASLLIFTGCLGMNYSFLMENLVVAGLLVKLGCAPMHQWVPGVVEGLSWGSLFIMFLMQKISPLAFMSVMSSYNSNLIISGVLLSALVGSVGGLTSSSLRKIMAYSSIAQLSWILSATLTSSGLWVSYFCIYFLILSSLLMVLNDFEVFNLNKMLLLQGKYKYAIGLSLLSLGGLPPFSGFLPKFIVVSSLLSEGQVYIFSFLLLGTFVSLFFYVRVVLTSMMMSSFNLSFSGGTGHKKEAKLVVNVFILGLPTLFFMF
uniref:NADH-ubiquinone oxidoreductase chain 2 n=1 Tax=Haustorioides koreanus TaxID=2729224 RepID=A0A6M3RXR8_9CRUS|nr:NADH dehydrogenase subunit 2 [Haustorioides koreanus]